MKTLKYIENSTRIGVISSLETTISEEGIMKQVICTVCKSVCVRNGKNKSGSQRWICRQCLITFTPKIDNSVKQLKLFLKWLFGKQTQKEMPGEGRTFRRKTSEFWNIWPLPPLVESKRDVLFVDGIYLGRKACILICCDEQNVLGWYLCRYEHGTTFVKGKLNYLKREDRSLL